jgi:hypothetical protein
VLPREKPAQGHNFRQKTTEKREDFDADGKRTVAYDPNGTLQSIFCLQKVFMLFDYF